MKFGKYGNKGDNKWVGLAAYGLVLVLALAIADLTIVYFRPLFLPNAKPPKKIQPYIPQTGLDRASLATIASRNFFSPTGVMPDAIKSQKEAEEAPKENTPIPSNLPITIIGTLVHSNPAKSIVALDLKSKNKTGSYTVGANVEGLCTIEKVERNIVYIRNLSNGMLEYIEMNKGGNKVAFDTAKPEAPKAKSVQVAGNNTFSLSRATLLKYTNDLSSILMQARAVPNVNPTTGEINGFRLLDMQPGSIYEELGLQRMDVIKGVNGEPVDSIQKAMEMYNTLKNGNQVKLQIERGGKVDTFTYEIK